MSSKEPPSELIRAKDLKGVDVWALPSFDPEVETPEPSEEELASEQPIDASDQATAESEEVALEDVKPLTLDELEAIRQDAYNEGFATGEKDGFHAGQLKAKEPSKRSPWKSCPKDAKTGNEQAQQNAKPAMLHRNWR